MKESINRIAYIIDEDGFVVDTIVVTSQDEYVEGNIVAISQPLGTSFWRKKWNGSEWIEGESEEEKLERESILLLESIYPTPEQIEDAKLEIKSIQIMTELGVLS